MRFPDVEVLAVAFLRSQVAPVAVGAKVPTTRPSQYVRAFRTGGAASNRALEEAQITVDAAAETEAEAWALASACREAFLHRYTLMPLVRAATEISGLHSTPDPDTNTPRYRFTVALMVRAGR